MVLKWERLGGRSGHDAAYALLARQVDVPLPEIRKTPQGKPYFPESDLHFSISHTENHAFCCIHTENVGLDAEECDRPVSLALAKKVLSASEMARFDAAADKQACLLRLWVLKESYAKLTGRGWGNYLYETDFDPDDPRIQIIDGCFVAVLTEEAKEDPHVI